MVVIRDDEMQKIKAVGGRLRRVEGGDWGWEERNEAQGGLVLCLDMCLVIGHCLKFFAALRAGSGMLRKIDRQIRRMYRGGNDDV